MLKKIIAIGCALVITSITLMGCGNSNITGDSQALAESTETIQESEQELTESEPTESEVIVQSEQEDATVEDNIWEYGTTNGNANNFSMFERRGNILYFINYGQAGALCSMDITGESDTFWNREFVPQVLYADGGNEINVVGDRIYFVTSYNDDTKCEIISMNTDGTDIKSLYKAPIKNMIVVNNWIYFLNADNNIEKMDVNGESHEVVLAEECYFLNVYEDKLIFQLDSDNESIYSINADGSELSNSNFALQ